MIAVVDYSSKIKPWQDLSLNSISFVTPAQKTELHAAYLRLVDEQVAPQFGMFLRNIDLSCEFGT